MHATIDVRFECSIDDEKTLPVAAIAEFVTEQDIEAAIVEEIVECLDERQVEAYCGEKHATGNGTKRFQRAGTTTRSAVTTAGELELTLHTVEDTAAEEDEASYFRPVEDTIAFDGQKQYQEDVSLRSVDRATDLSYRNAADGDGSGLLPSPSTINRRVKEYGDKLGGFLRDRLAGTEAETVGADGTKCHSQDDGRTYQHVAVTLEQGEEEPTATLLDVSVNAPWDTIATTLDETDAIAEDATVVSDAEERLVEAFTDDDRDHQLDLCHIGRTTSHMLWEDDAFSLAEREEIVAEVTSDVFHLKHSVETHRPEGPLAAIRSRIASTKNRVKRLAWQLEMLSCPRTAAYLRSWLPSVVTFAEAAMDGGVVPWTSNPVERAMGELSNRCKRQWMRWTESGLEAMLHLLLTKYANPDLYEAFCDEVLNRASKTQMRCDLSVEATRGEL